VHVPISQSELEKLLSLSSNGFDPKTIPLTHHDGEHGSFAIESEAIGADAAWALGNLAKMRTTSPVNGPGDRGLTDQEADRLWTVISGALAQRLATEASRVGAIRDAVRAWLDTLT